MSASESHSVPPSLALHGTPTLIQGNLYCRCKYPGCCCQGSSYPFEESCEVVLHAISVIFCEAVAIYGVIMAIILQGKINDSKCINNFDDCAFAGYSLFWTGISVGFSNLFCGYTLPDLEFA